MTKTAPQILLLYSVKDSGHQRAAEAVKEALLDKSPELDISDLNVLTCLWPKFGRLLHNLYLQFITRCSGLYNIFWDNQMIYKGSRLPLKLISRSCLMRFKARIADIKPSAIVCTQAFACSIASSYKSRYDNSLKIFAVITDYEVHSYWVQDNVDGYFASCQEVAQHLVQKGIEEERIIVTGIPVEPAFNHNYDRKSLCAQLELDPDKPVIMVMGGSLGLGPMDEIIRGLKAVRGGYQAVIIAGKNEKVRERLIKEFPQRQKSFKVLGYVDNVHEYLSVADLLITKPGGLSITEASVKGVPLLVYEYIQGQERRNYQYLMDKDIALSFKKAAELSEKIDKLLNDEKLRDRYQEAVKILARPRAVEKIAEAILKTI